MMMSECLECCAEPCNLRGDCQTNNTCFCTNGYKSCVPSDGTIISASAGCETYVYGDPNNCGTCGNVSPYPTVGTNNQV